MTHNEKLTLRRVWPENDWPRELDAEHARRAKINHRMGYGLALNTAQLFELISMFCDAEGVPLSRHDAPVFDGRAAKEHAEEQTLKRPAIRSSLISEMEPAGAT